MNTVERTEARVRRSMTNLASLLTRVERGHTGATPDGLQRNIAATTETAQYHLLNILTGLVVLEDANGVEAITRLIDRATTLRQRMQAVGLVGAADVSRIEDAALRRADELSKRS